jgi:outer membrane protein insertion porin family
MYSFFLKSFLIFCLLTLPALSKNYNDIIINGNKRISNETIKVFSEIKDNKILDENSLNLILKNLYKTGFFKTVSVKIENNSLIINVLENPIIQSVFIKGIKTDKLTKAINDALILKSRSSFNKTSAKTDEITILNILKVNGYYFSTLKSFTENIGDNRIDLTYQITTGKKAKIKKISFIGDKKFKDSKLRNIIVSEEYKFWKFLSGKKFLNESLIRFDTQLLENYYKNNGFYNIKIESSFANYLGKDEFEVIYNISSGKKFLFNNLTLSLPIDFDPDYFADLQDIFSEVKNQNYSLNTVDKILKEIDKITLNEQYEFLTATVEENIDGNLINLVFNINESEKYYVEKINILGNNITREEVIRNILIVDEGDPFNELLHNRSINKIKSLNFFSEVVSNIDNGSSNNQKIVNINVSEKPTGEIMAGAGIGTNGGSVAFGITENNFLGRGIQFGSDLTISDETIKGLLSLNNPNYNGSNRSLGVQMESSTTDRLKDFGYQSDKIGLSVNSGFEYYDDFFLNMGFSSYLEKLETNSTASAGMKKQKGSYFDTYANYTLNYDKRNQSYQTTDGYRSTFSQSIPVITESNTLISSYDYKLFNKWIDENIATFNFYVASANSMTGKDVKLSERLFLPSNKLRGFENGKIGPKDGADYIGGNYAMSLNMATTIPQILPNSQNTDFGLFIDTGNVWGVDFSPTNLGGSKIRSSVGLSLDYFSAIGPLNFSWAKAITKGQNDVVETFRFNLGTTF